MKVEFVAQAAHEVQAAWKLMPETERSLEMLADVAVQVVLDLCVNEDEKVAEQ